MRATPVPPPRPPTLCCLSGLWTRPDTKDTTGTLPYDDPTADEALSRL